MSSSQLLSCQRSLFDLPEDIAYLNCAYMSPQLRSVTEAGIKGIQQKAFPYEIAVHDFFDPVKELKTEFCRLLNRTDADRVALVPSVSYGMAQVAKNLPLKTGQNLVMTAEQFPSNYYCWEEKAKEVGAEIRMVAPPLTQGSRAHAWSEALLEAIDEKTALVTLGQVHWADGTLFDLPAIRVKSEKVGAWLALDLTQSLGSLPFDMDAIRPDALICAGYKWLMGPYSIGLAWFGPVMDSGKPIEENWINRQGSEDFAGLVNYQEAYHPKARRYSVGESSHFIMLPMFLEALRQVNAWGPERIQTYAGSLLEEPLARLQALGCSMETPEGRGNHLLGIRFPAYWNQQQLKQALLGENIYVSYRGSAVRVSVHVYNRQEELDRLCQVLERVHA